MSIYDGGGWGNRAPSTERPGSLVDSGRTRRLPAFQSQQHWIERAQCSRQHRLSKFPFVLPQTVQQTFKQSVKILSMKIVKRINAIIFPKGS